jgi:hypothetical protein
VCLVVVQLYTYRYLFIIVYRNVELYIMYNSAFLM